MRIAGINSPNYHHNQLPKTHNRQSPGQPAEGDQSRVAQSNPLPVAAADTARQLQEIPTVATHQKGALMQRTANDLSKISGISDERVRFYAGSDASAEAVWNASPHGGYRGGETSSAIPDNTSHKARTAIAEYLQTQFLDERTHFEQVLGVDEYV
jgi:hypothetical protein